MISIQINEVHEIRWNSIKFYGNSTEIQWNSIEFFEFPASLRKFKEVNAMQLNPIEFYEIQ